MRSARDDHYTSTETNWWASVRSLSPLQIVDSCKTDGTRLTTDNAIGESNYFLSSSLNPKSCSSNPLIRSSFKMKNVPTRERKSSLCYVDKRKWRLFIDFNILKGITKQCTSTWGYSINFLVSSKRASRFHERNNCSLQNGLNRKKNRIRLFWRSI